MDDFSSTIDVLCKYLKDDNFDITYNEAWGNAYLLGELKVASPPVIAILVQHLMSNSLLWQLRSCCLASLQKLGWQPQTDEEKAWSYVIQKQWKEAGKLGIAAVRPLLLAMHHPFLNRAASKTLLDAGQSIIPTLLEVLDQIDKEEYRTRQFFFKTLGNILVRFGPHPAILAFAEKGLHHHSQEFRDLSVKILKKFRWKPPNDEIYAYFLIAQKQWKKLQKLGKDAIPALLESLVAFPYQCQIVLLNLGHIAIPYLEKKLLQIYYKDPCSIVVKTLAILATVYHQATMVLSQGIHHPYNKIREACILYLQQLGYDALIPKTATHIIEFPQEEIRALGDMLLHTQGDELLALMEILPNLNEQIRPIIPEICSLVTPESVADFLKLYFYILPAIITIAQFAPNHPQLIATIQQLPPTVFLQVLQIFPQEEQFLRPFIPTLLTLLASETEEQRELAITALQKAGWQPQSSGEKAWFFMHKKQWKQLQDLGEEAVPALLSAFFASEEYEGTEHETINEILGLLGPKAAKAVPILSKRLRIANPETRSLYARTLVQIGTEVPGVAVALSFCLHDTNPNIRMMCSHALKNNRKCDIPSLMEGMKHPVSYVRELSANTLCKMGWRPKTPEEKAWLAVAKKQWWRARQLGRFAIPALLCALADEMPYFQQISLHTLGQMGSAAEDALPRLSKLAVIHERISKAYLQTIEKIGRHHPSILPSLLASYYRYSDQFCSDLGGFIAKTVPSGMQILLQDIQTPACPSSFVSGAALLAAGWKPSTPSESFWLSFVQKQWNNLASLNKIPPFNETFFMLEIWKDCPIILFPFSYVQAYFECFLHTPKYFELLLSKFGSQKQKIFAMLFEKLQGNPLVRGDLAAKALKEINWQPSCGKEAIALFARLYVSQDVAMLRYHKKILQTWDRKKQCNHYEEEFIFASMMLNQDLSLRYEAVNQFTYRRLSSPASLLCILATFCIPDFYIFDEREEENNNKTGAVALYKIIPYILKKKPTPALQEIQKKLKLLFPSVQEIYQRTYGIPIPKLEGQMSFLF